ncbi:DMT family transporter [Psychrobacillus sp.]|uniref:DMT family transporter n=1 Tax=Psychrobacillus sp. TaxID=1871623 RepID=UPI0028BEB496|nr:DMT family transporter [Psychrobacillus sp.]
MTTNTKAYFAAILYALIVGFSFMFVKLSLIVATPLDTLAHRFTIALIIASVIIILKKVPLNMTKRAVWRILPLALIYPILFFTFQTFGLVYASSSEAGIIQATVPVFTLLLAAFFLKEHTTPLQKISVLLSVSGVIYIFVMNGASIDSQNMKGIILILLSALTASCNTVLARRLVKQYSFFTVTYVMTFFGFIFFNVVAIGNHTMTHTMLLFIEPLSSGTFIVAILYLGALSSLATSFFSNYALLHIEASKMSVFSNLATLISIIAGVFFLNETIEKYHMIGTLIILVGVAGTIYCRKKV